MTVPPRTRFRDAHRVGLCVLAGALLFLLPSLLLSHFAPAADARQGVRARSDDDAERSAGFHSEVRDVRIGELRFPVYSPSWSDGHPLAGIRRLLERDDSVTARRHWDRFLREAPGNLIVPPDLEAALDRIDDPARVIRQWFEGLGPLSGELAWHGSAPTITTDSQLSPGNPMLWHPRAAAQVEQAFSLALERGDWTHCHLLLESPNGSTLGRWRGWLYERLAESWNGTQQLPPSAPVPQRLTRLFHLQLSENLDVRPAPLPTQENPRVPWRRSPLRPIEPRLASGQAMIQTGSRLFAIDYLRESPQLIWELPQYGEAPLPALLVQTAQAVGSARWVVSTPRAHLDEKGMQRATALDRTKLGLPWNRLWIGTRDQPQSQPQPHPIPLLTAATWCNGMRIEGDILYGVRWQGWGQAQLILTAIDLSRSTVIWECPLGSREFPWHSAEDLRDKVSEPRLLSWGHDLIVTHGWGWMARVGKKSGRLRGVLLYDRHPLEEYRLPVTPSLISGTRWSRLPAPRCRATGPALLVADDSKRPLLVVLPPDASQVLAVDLATWTVQWKHAVTPQTQLLGLWQDQVVLLDCGIEKGENSLELKRLNVKSGLLAVDPQLLRCSVDETRWPTDADNALPLLAGTPQLFADTVWLPELDGLSLWRIPELDRHFPLPSSYLPWPAGATGGTPTLLSEKRILFIHRGDASLGVAPTVEIYETQ